jgi:ParB-like chromosome segregation protein Spo0J
METKNISISKLQLNEGQITGLPRNPRFIKDERYEALKKSIQDDPEMLELRELLVYPFKGNFIVIGGNMRLRACKELGFKEMPCKVIDVNTRVEKLRAISVKDNVSFGDIDWDALANEWDLAELQDFGLDTSFLDDADSNIDALFDENPEKKEKEQKPVVCPHCGKNIYDLPEKDLVTPPND